MDDDQDAAPAKLPDIRVEQADGLPVIRFRPAARWDGHELALLGTVLAKLRRQGIRQVAIDMGGVRHLRSGYFGLLFDTQGRGVKIQLLNPDPCVQQMLWFQEFADEVAAGQYQLRREPRHKGRFDDDHQPRPRQAPKRYRRPALSAPVGVAGEGDSRPATV